MNNTYNEYRIIIMSLDTDREYITTQYVSRTGEISGKDKILAYYPLHNILIIDIFYIQSVNKDYLSDMALYVDLSDYLTVENWYDDYLPPIKSRSFKKCY